MSRGRDASHGWVWIAWAVCVGVAAGCVPAGVTGQERPDAVEALLRGTTTGARLRLIEVDGTRLHARYWGIVDDRIRLRPNSGPDVFVPPDAVRSIEVCVSEAGSRARVAGIAGAAIGGTLGFAAGAMCDHPGCGGALTSVVVGAALVGGVGALLGAVVGELFGGWEPVYPNRERS